MRERLIGYGLGAWRRRWLGVATAWLVCLIGWSATLLLTGDPGSSNLLQGDPPATAVPQGSERAAAASPVIALEAGGGGASGKAAQPSQEARQTLATLQSDLAAALLLRGLQARRLAGLPPALDGGRQRNPLHERAAIQLGQQAALIAALQRQIAAEQARILALEGTRRSFDAARVPEDPAPERALRPVGVPHALTRPALGAAEWEVAGDSDRPAVGALVASTRPTTPAGVRRTALLAGVLALGAAAGAAVAVWRGRLHRLVADAWQLQERFRLPVLGVISRPNSAEQRRRQWIAWAQVCLACGALLGLFGGLVTADTCDLLAPLGAPLRAPELQGAAGLIIGIHYSRSAARRGPGASLPERAVRRLGFRETDPGAWRVPPQAASAAGEDEAALPAEAPAEIECAPAPTMVDRAQLIAGGYLDRDTGIPALFEQLRPVAGALVAQASAPGAGRRDRMILVTSPNSGEGKSFTAVNLALALAHGGRAVLLIDGDPRTAGSTRALGLVPEPGLADALAGAALDGLVHPTGLDHLWFMAPGRPHAALTRMLASRRTAQLVRDLLAQEPHGLAVVDGPPLLSGAAGAALAMFAGQVVLVAAAGRTAEPALAASVKRLGERRNVGFVLTRAGNPPADRNRPTPAPA
jgi:protein-tyrosine kinase